MYSVPTCLGQEGLQSCTKGSFGKLRRLCADEKVCLGPGVFKLLSHFQILHVLKRPCQGQKHCKLTGGNPRENQDVKSTAGSLENGSPADLAGWTITVLSGRLSPWRRVEGNQRARKRKVGARRYTIKQDVAESQDKG